MATELGKAYVQIIPSAKGIKSSVEKEMNGVGEASGTTVGGGLVSTIKKIIGVAAIGTALKAAITEGADLEQSIGGIETLFKESADKVKANAAEAYRTAGMSANEYMELTTSFSASLLQSLGSDTAKAADIADMAMTDMSDNANKMGTNMEDIKNAYQGFAKQNYTMLDNLKLGYGGTKTEMERLLADAKEITGVEYDIDNLADVYSAIHVIQGELDITGTTAKEAASTISGSFNSMKAAFKNVLGELTLGMDVSDSLKALATTTTTFLIGNLLPAIWNVLSSLPGALVSFVGALIPQVATALSQGVPKLITGILTAMRTGIPRLLQQANAWIDQIAIAIETKLPEMMAQGSKLLTHFINGVRASFPQLASMAGELISNLVTAIVTYLPQVLTGIQSAISALLPQISALHGEIFANLKTTLDQNLPILLQEGVTMITNLVNGFLQGLPQVITMAGQMVSNFLNAILPQLPTIMQAGADLLINLLNGIINNLPQIVGAIAQVIAQIVTTIGQNLPQILQSGITILGQLQAGLIRAIPNLIAQIPNIITRIKNAFTNTDWGAIGRNIIKGISNGLAAAGHLMWDAVKGVLGSFKDQVLSFFGIHSPSRWGIYVGEMIDAGMAKGITGALPTVASAVDGLQEMAQAPFYADASYKLGSGSGSGADSGTADRLDTLIALTRASLNAGQTVKVQIGEREFIRTLRDMGVSFA